MIYQLGETYDELGGSEFYSLLGELGANVPKVRKEAAKELYLAVMKANEGQLIASSHDLSDGGLAVALTEAAFGGQLGARIDLTALGNLSNTVKLFSESHSRFVVSVAPEHQAAFEAILGERAFLLGKVTQKKEVVVWDGQNNLIQMATEQLLKAWSEGLLL